VALTRREFLLSSSAVLAGAAGVPAFARVPSARRQAAQGQPATKFEDVRRGVGIFTGQGGTIGWLANPDGALVVDAQFPATASVCLAGVKERSPKDIQFLINTHHHADHVSGNPTFRDSVKHILQQERCATYHKTTTEKAGTAAKQAFADVTFGGSWSTTIGDEKIWADYYGAGHTGGDAIIFFERANVVHMGDLFFNHLHPFVDRPNGASIRSWIKVIEKATNKHKDAIFIAGHAKPGLPATGTAQDVLAFRDYFSAVLDHVHKGIKANKSEAEITSLTALPKFEDYASPAAALSLSGTLTMAYQELTNKPPAPSSR
jgi:glyoxylase-like metal-dependent hydrolase (beta-lactamase superfamily II)